MSIDYSRYHYGTEYLCPVCREWCDGSDRDPFDRLRACDACAAPPTPAPAAHSFTTRVDLVRRYRYFRAQGERAHYSLYLARAEMEARRRGWYVAWAPDDSCFCGESESACACLRGVCECEYASLWRYADTDSERLGTALGGICGADDAYRRVVAAELYSAELDAERETRAAHDRNAAQMERMYASARWAAL